MVRRTAVALALLTVACSTNAYTVAPQGASVFGGRSLSAEQRIPAGRTTRGDMCMKKGKPNVPLEMRGQYKKSQETAQMRDQMQAAQSPGSDGLPVFNLYVRSKVAGVSFLLD